MTDTTTTSQSADQTWSVTKTVLCSFARAYGRALRTWGVVGLVLMLVHWAIFAVLGAARAKEIGIDKMLLEASGIGSFLMLAFFVALVLWAVRAVKRWGLLSAPAARITRWVGETTTAAAALFSGVAVVALIPACCLHDRVARTLVLQTLLLLVMLFVVNWILALARSFYRDKQGRAMGLVVLVGVAVELVIWVCLLLIKPA